MGDLIAELALRSSLFLATKVWTSGRDAGVRQMEESFRLLRTQIMDLMQIHNLVDWKTHTATLKQWKQQGRVRYIGITHYHEGAYDELERLIKTRQYDFVQLNYSIAEREAEEQCPAARAGDGRGRHRQPALREGQPVLARARKAGAGVGRRTSTALLGAVLPQVHRVPPGGDLRHPCDQQPQAHGGQHDGRRRAIARRRDAATHGQYVDDL